MEIAYPGALLEFMPRSDGKSVSGKAAPKKTAGKKITKKVASGKTDPKPKKTAGKSKKAIKQVGTIKIGPPKLTRFEKARILGARSLQLALGAPPFIAIDPNIKDPISLALSEIDANALPISIRRKLSNGNYQDIAIDWLV